MGAMSRELAAELLAAESAQHRTDCQLGIGFEGVLLRTIDREWAQDVAELAMERAALSESAPGLVSVPTSGRATASVHKIPFSQRAAEASIFEALQTWGVAAEGLRSGGRRQLVAVERQGAFVPDPVLGRWSRLRRTIGVAARGICTMLPDQWRTVMVTLTYEGGNENWNPRHVSDFLKHVRRWFDRRELTFRYVWVAELQKRGVIHYHVALWLPPGVDLPKPDVCSAKWHAPMARDAWWPHGMTKIETARKAVPYLMSYLKKGDGIVRGSLPNGARCHGRGGLGEQFRAVLRWLALPAFIQAQSAVGERWERAEGGGWLSPFGVHWASEFAREWVGNGYALVRKLSHAGRTDGGALLTYFQADGPFTRLPMPKGV